MNATDYSTREQRSWYAYDWANSAFSTTVVTVFLGPYLTSVTKSAADASGYVHPFGIPIEAGSFYPYLISFSVLSQVFALPVLGALADYAQAKKQFMGVFAYVGAFATMAMLFVTGQHYLLGGLLFLIANLSFGASIVFYNAFLPEIAAPEDRDAVSSKGFAWGYIGGGALLALNMFICFKPAAVGLTTGQAVRLSIASAGLWWATFTVIPMLILRNRRPAKHLPRGGSYLTVGFEQLTHTVKSVRLYPQTLLFLAAYLLYNDGIQTVISLASQFGQEELHLSIGTLTSAILMVQFVAFAGSLLFNKLAGMIGSKQAVMVSLVIWTLTLVYAYAAVSTAGEFYAMAAVIGLILGGSQALSRSIYAQMIPAGREAEYFSLYEVSDKGTSWLGPLAFGLALQFTHSYRIAIVSLIIFFIVGLVLLLKVNVERAAAEAHSEAAGTAA